MPRASHKTIQPIELSPRAISMTKDTTVVDRSTFSDLPQVAGVTELEHLADVPVPAPLKDDVAPESLRHREFEGGEFWRHVPAFADVPFEKFMDHKFQLIHTVNSVDKLREVAGEIISEDF